MSRVACALTLIVAVATALLMLAVIPPAVYGATTLTVTTTDDELTPNGRCSLREAIRNANADHQLHPDCPAGNGDDTIVLGAGTYRLTIGGTDEEAAATGDLDLTSVITLVGSGPNATVIDGNQIDRVIDVRQEGSATLRGLMIRGGLGPTVRGDPSGGGGIRNLGRTSLVNVAVTQNAGRGIHNDAVMTVTSASVTENVADDGGGVYNGGTLTLEDVEIANNRALPGIARGSAGGVLNDNGTITMLRVAISNNSATTGAGGGIYLQRGAIELVNVTISGNSANLGGGGIFVSSGTTTLTNVTIYENLVAGLLPPGTAHNIRVADTIRARNTIVANRSGIPNCTAPLVSEGSNLESSVGCGFTSTGDLQNTNPLLGPLADNGGPTGTHQLLTGSPAIDAAFGAGCPPTDQRGAPRPRDGNGDGNLSCDIGAFEAPLAMPSPTPTATPPPQACNPRPNVQVRASAAAQGVLRVELTAQTQPGAPANGLQQLTVTRMVNATVRANDDPVNVNQPVGLRGAATATFTVQRVQSGAATTVYFTVRDACGDWPTFVGGGPHSF